MKSLINKENSSKDKILKPDFNQKTGRELLAFYLQSKFKQILAYDRKCPSPIFIEVRPDFISKFSKRLITSPQKRILIGITGESACGKSTICGQIKKTIQGLNLPVSIINSDNYFNDISELIKQYGDFDNLRDNGYDVDSPDSFQLDLLKNDLETIAQGEDIKIPQYLLNGSGLSIPESIEVKSQKIIVVEGMSTMYKDVKNIFDIKIYIDTCFEERKQRFFNRATERNQNEENAQKHWNYVKIAGEKYVQPTKSDADIILSGNSDLIYFSQILEYIYTITNNFQSAN
jgi:uridine kinase